MSVVARGRAPSSDGRDLRRLTDRVTRLEASQEALAEALARIEGLIRALDGRMLIMTQELGRVAGRLEGGMR